MKKDSISVSLPRAKTVRGYEIRKMPLGAYLQAIQILQDLPEELLSVVFPGKPPEEVWEVLARLDQRSFLEIVSRGLTAMPERVIAIFAKLSGLEAEELIGDPAVGPDGLLEMLQAWTEVNEIENFMRALKPLGAKLRSLMTNGFKG